MESGSETSIPKEVTEVWGKLHQEAEKQYLSLTPVPKRGKLITHGIKAIAKGAEKALLPKKPHTTASDDNSVVLAVNPEVTEVWEKLHQEAVDRIHDLNPEEIDTTDMSPTQAIKAGVNNIKQAIGLKK